MPVERTANTKLPSKRASLVTTAFHRSSLSDFPILICCSSTALILTPLKREHFSNPSAMICAYGHRIYPILAAEAGAGGGAGGRRRRRWRRWQAQVGTEAT